jgi:GntR family transcriptional regulator of arabinose operon
VDWISIDREGAIPLHVQLLNQLRHLILSGTWAPDARIPSEPELQRQLNISRSTVRQALSNAKAEGLIVRVPGKGTYVASSASGQRSCHLLGYITDDCCDPMQSQVLMGAETIVTAHGFRILFGNSNGAVREESRILDQLVLEDRVAGILVWPVPRKDLSGRLLELCHQGVIPLAAVDRTVEGLSCDLVTSQNYAGAYAAVRHLVELGHRRIALLSHPITYVTTVAERWRGYQAALRDAGLTPREPWLVGSVTREMSVRIFLGDGVDDHRRYVEEIGQYLDSTERPTAIFAVNDIMSIQAMKAARSMGLDVPEDLSLVGFDDNSIINALLDVPLTTVAQDAASIGRRAAELLIERVKGYKGSPRRELLPTELRVRASTAPPAAFRRAGRAVERKTL